MSSRITTLSIMMKDAEGNRRVFEFNDATKVADIFVSEGKLGAFLRGLRDCPTPTVDTPSPDDVTDSKAEVG